MVLKQGKTIRTDYENFIAKCPHCRHRNIFNRRTDLLTCAPISHQNVNCEKCGRSFFIGGDLAPTAWRYLIFDCYDLFKQKKYMACILNLCQACEMFFLYAIEYILIHKPEHDELFENLEQCNKFMEKLHKKIKGCTFVPLRNIVVDMCSNEKKFPSVKEIEDYINAINVTDCSTPDISGIQPEEKRQYLKVLLDLKIYKTRNNVVHKYGYRPHRDEVFPFLNGENSVKVILLDVEKIMSIDDMIVPSPL